MKTRLIRTLTAILLPVILPVVEARAENPPVRLATTSAPSTGNRFEKEIAAFEAADRKAQPPKGAVLFVGDSGIKKWTTVTQDFPDQTVINRGFGGSTMTDALLYVSRIAIPYQPRIIVLREGGNDLTSGHTAEQFMGDLKQFVTKVHTALPQTRIAIFSLNPNPARWNQAEKRKAANVILKAYAQSETYLSYIDVWDQFLGPDGTPREDLFQKDRLHNNADGNKIYTDAVRPHLK